MLNLAIATSDTAPPPPCICPQNVDPVCATDGVTYTNPCYLACENARRKQLGLPLIEELHKGKCKVQVNCPSNIVMPICGTDKRTYHNVCYLQWASQENVANGKPPINLDYLGVCKKDTGCVCPAVYDPVCGSDGKTYGNLCLLICENKKREQQVPPLPPIKVAYKGECIKCYCSDVWYPVCASNYQTFGNSCKLDCENIKRWYQNLPLLWKMWNGVC